MAPTLRKRSEPQRKIKSRKPIYKLSDHVLCKFNEQLYDAIILEVKHVDLVKKEAEAAGNNGDGTDTQIVRSMSKENMEHEFPDDFAYYLHYKNWNANWDEWVRSDCLVPISEESRKQQNELKLKARKEKIKKTLRKKRRRHRRKSTLSQSQNGDTDDTQNSMDYDEKFDSSALELGSQDSINAEESLSATREEEEEADQQKHVYVYPPEVDETGIEENRLLNSNPNSALKLLPEITSPCRQQKIVIIEEKAEVSNEEASVSSSKSEQSENTMELEEKNETQNGNGSDESGKHEEDGCHLNEVAPTSTSILKPNANDLLFTDLLNHLSSIPTIGFTLGSAFIKKLKELFESYCTKVCPTTATENAEKCSKTKAHQNVNDVNTTHVAAEQLGQLIDELNTGVWKRQKMWSEFNQNSGEVFDVQLVTDECRDYFEAVKTFLYSRKTPIASPSNQMEVDSL